LVCPLPPPPPPKKKLSSIATVVYHISFHIFFLLFLGYTAEKLEELKDLQEQRMLSDIKENLEEDEDFDIDVLNEQNATLVSRRKCHHPIIYLLY